MFNLILVTIVGAASVWAAETPKVRSGSIDSGITIPQIAVGGGWDTKFQIFNLENTVQPYVLSFFDSDGRPMSLTLFDSNGTPLGSVSIVAGVLAPAGSRFIFSSPEGALKSGYATLGSDSFLKVAVNAVLTQTVPGRPAFQASVPSLSRFQDHIRFPFANVGGFTTTVAWKSDARQNVTMIARSQNGVELCRASWALADEKQEAVILQNRLPCTAQRDGIIEVVTDFVGLTAIAFLFNDQGPFTTQVPLSICCLN